MSAVPLPVHTPVPAPMRAPMPMYPVASPTAFPPCTNVDAYPASSRNVRVLPPIQAPIKHRRVVIFDWDDTLFPTSAWIQRSKLNKSAGLAALRKLGKAVYDLLAYYLKLFGAKNVRVVTNGTKSWVLKSLQQCSQRYRKLCAESEEEKSDSASVSTASASTASEADADYFAAIYNSFMSLDILVSSARDMHGQDFPQHGASWKMRAFKSIVKRHFNLFSSSDNNVYSMVSIGDSEDEFVASFETKRMVETQNRLNRNNNIVRLHRVKLKKHPRLEDILSQIAMLTVEAEALFHAEEPITIRCDPEVPTDIGV